MMNECPLRRSKLPQSPRVGSLDVEAADKLHFRLPDHGCSRPGRLLGLLRVQEEVVAIKPFNSLLYTGWSPPEMTLTSSVNFWMVLSIKDTRTASAVLIGFSRPFSAV